MDQNLLKYYNSLKSSTNQLKDINRELNTPTGETLNSYVSKEKVEHYKSSSLVRPISAYTGLAST
jgi:hypothetical protein